MPVQIVKRLRRGLCLSFLFCLLLSGCGGDASQSIPTSVPASTGGAVSSDEDPDGSGGLSPQSEGILSVSYLDVGQGDSTFIQLPDGKTMLIDAGEAEYGQTVIDYIESQGAQKIDYLVATHPHSDHIGGLPAVVSHFDVGAVYMPKVQSNTRIFEQLLQSISDKNLKITEAKAGVTIFSSDGLSAEIVAPNSDSYSDLNNYSAVIRLVYGNTSFLFTGDAEEKSEKEITAEIRADVLKAGHHGSAYSTSPDFLKKVSPTYAVISCGANNQYGHPEAGLLQRLSQAGAKIYRTDESGTVVFESDGKTISVREGAQSNPANPSLETPSQGAEETDTQTNAGTDVVVYVTKTGTKYHLESCSSLRQSKIPIDLETARASYEPCQKCNPPR